MAFFFPFSTLHELNLDWILNKVKEFAELIPPMQEAAADVQQALEESAQAVQTANDAKAIAEQAAQAVVPDGSITTPKLADGAVTNIKLGDDAVTTAKIQDDAITHAKMANNSVGLNELQAGCVGTTKLMDGAVTAIKIDANAVTNSKIADGAVTESKIDTDAVTNSKISDNAVTFNKLSLAVQNELAVTSYQVNIADVTTTEGTLISVGFIIRYTSQMAWLTYDIRLSNCTTQPTITITNIPTEIPEFVINGNPSLWGAAGSAVATDISIATHAANSNTVTITMPNFIGTTGTDYLQLLC